jgi:hypothetical protein
MKFCSEYCVKYCYLECIPKSDFEPSFDEIINPTGNWDEDLPTSKPKHERKDKKMQKLLSVLAKTFIVGLFFVGILWLADVAGDLLNALFGG